MKTALITGSTKGIGKAIAIDLLAQGCRVILNYANDDAEANNLISELQQKYSQDNFCVIKADLSSVAGLESLINAALNFSATIDYLVLNTAITDKTPFQLIHYGNWEKVIDTNLNIPFLLVQRLVNYIQQNGKIIFIGAILGIYPHATSLAYGVSKAAVHFLAKSLVKEFEHKKVTVNVVAPGFVETPWQTNKTTQHRQSIENKTAMHRFATPEEVSMAVMSIIHNDFINGHVLQVDGGYNYK